MVTIAKTNSQPSGLKLESLTHIDISKLSHSELQTLSLCSDASFDLRGGGGDVFSPPIDRTIFNESAGSRRQTHSRLRLAPRPLDSTVAGHRHRLSGMDPSRDDHERAENNSIVSFLKQLITGKGIEIRPKNRQLVPRDQTNTSERTYVDTRIGLGVQEMQIVLQSSEGKRKRGRKPKVNVICGGGGGGVELEIVNRNGVAVDLAALENSSDDWFCAELKRRTVGLETEEEVLGFLSNLEGQWGSRRKKRKLVDASEFGDALPIGWKLLLSLRRREGHVSLHCRRYISPTGQQFESCKEVSSYLRSYFGYNDAGEPIDRSSGNIHQQALIVPTRSNAGLIHNHNVEKQDIVSNSVLPSSSLSDERENEVSLSGIDNLAEVQVQDLFECYKCNVSFNEKDAYMQHLLSTHQQTTRRYRLGTSIGEGVIIKDGKYECQFCHKVFQEKRSYNGHVGNHVKKYLRTTEESRVLAVQRQIESASRDELPSRISKMDALIEIAQSSILETPKSGPDAETEGGHSYDKLDLHTIPEIPPTCSDHVLSLVSAPSEMEMEKTVDEGGLSEELDQHGSEHHIAVHISTSEQPKPDEEDKHGNSELEFDIVLRNNNQNRDAVKENVELTVEDVSQNRVAESSMLQGADEFCTVDQRLENVTGFEEIRWDEIEPLKYNFVNEQESLAPPQVSIDLAKDGEIEGGFNSLDGFESGTIMLNMAGGNQLTALCVWCRMEFNHDVVDPEAQSDAIGFMCPTCKASISGQLNVFDSGLSMNSHQF